MRTIVTLIICLLLLGAVGGTLVILKKNKPEAAKVEKPKLVPTVEVFASKAVDINLQLPSQGIVMPRRTTVLAAEVHQAALPTAGSPGDLSFSVELLATMNLGPAVTQHTLVPQRGIWRRYSVFLHRGAPLIVTEWFAPEVLDWPIDHRKLTPIRRLQPRIQKQQHRRA